MQDLANWMILERAAKQVVRGRRRSADIAWFLLAREKVLLDLHQALSNDTWQPDPLSLHFIRDPKHRVICRPSVSDRIAHAAMTEAIAQQFERSLMPNDFAGRPGLGVHRAILRLQYLLRRHRHVVHLDIRSYFPSIDISLALRLLAPRMRSSLMPAIEAVLTQGPKVYQNPRVRRFAKLSTDWPPIGRGLPIGTSVSQYVATHVYLMTFDHWIKRTLKVPGYVRYGDDLFLFGNAKGRLKRWRDDIGMWLAAERGLQLKHPHAPILSCHGTLTALGYHLTRRSRQPRKQVFERMHRRITAHLDNREPVDIERSFAATVGVVLF